MARIKQLKDKYGTQQIFPKTLTSAVYDENGDTLDGVLENLSGSVAPIETGTASQSYAVGDYLLLNGQFCKVTAAIATGETISVGTNVAETSVAEEIGAEDVTSQVTSQISGMTVYGKQIWKIGRNVYIYLYFDMPNSYTAIFTTIFSGFPKPLFAMIVGDYETGVSATVEGNGVMVLQKDVAASTRLKLSGCYVAE